MARTGLTCRHDVTPRSACRLCMAEDNRMRRASQRAAKSPPKPKLSAKERYRLLVEANRRILAEQDAKQDKNNR
jgi:hypothetical protein